MSEGTYEYACMRAELLGIDKPDYEEFMKNRQEEEAKIVEDEEIDIECIKEAEEHGESTRKISGGLDELNNILSATQQKLNKFKVSCGSLTNLLKIKIGHGSSSSSLDNPDTAPINNEDVEPNPTTERELEAGAANGSTGSSTSSVRKSDLTRALDKDVSNLDRMLERAENAQYSMSHQTKQMRSFLK